MSRKMHDRLEVVPSDPYGWRERERARHDARFLFWVYLLCAFAGGFLLGAMTGRVPL